MNKFNVFSHLSFFRITKITDRAVVQSFLYMNWFSMLFQIDFLRRIKVTTLTARGWLGQPQVTRAKSPIWTKWGSGVLSRSN